MIYHNTAAATRLTCEAALGYELNVWPRGRPTRSVVIPVYNGAATIERVVEELIHSAALVDEIVLVNDGSSDDSEQVCRELVVRYPGRITLVQLSRNFGEYAAVTAGLLECRGMHAAIVDDDGQQCPDDAATLFRAAETYRFDAVYGRYSTPRQSWHRRLLSRLHHATAGWLLGKPRGLTLSSFKVVNRFLIERLRERCDPSAYLDGMILQTTQNIAQVDVDHRQRMQGRSGYTLLKLWRLWWNAIVSYSDAPFQTACVAGLLIASLGAIQFARFHLHDAFADGDSMIGYTSEILVACGMVLFYLGYVGACLRVGRPPDRTARPFVVRYILREEPNHD